MFYKPNHFLKTLMITITLLLSLNYIPGNKVFAAEVPESRPIVNEEYANKESLQPFGTVLQVDELKNWSPDKDPDAKYNRSFIPLQDRYMGELVNEFASEEARVLSLAMTNPRASESKSQGGSGADVYAFTHFQYLDIFNFWGGSAHEGIIAIPNPEHIDAAHKNGVKATATIFFPWGDSEFVEEAMEQFTEKDSEGNYIIAEKLFEIAEYYGFEGFFINQESDISESLANDLKAMLKYIQNNKPEGFVMQWYDSMTPNGKINYQNGVNENNIGMIQDGEDRLNDDVFLNFDWNKDRIDKSLETMENADRSQYDIHATWEYFPYSKDPGRVEDIIDDNGIIQTSIGLLSATTTLTNSNNPDDFQNNEDPKLWVGPSGDPRDSERNEDEFPGISSLVADKSPVVGSNFITHFNAGNGHRFYEKGIVINDESWHNRSLTDILPTWRWIVNSEGNKLSPKIDYEDAYFGGSSLKIQGNLEKDKPNDINLYSTDLDVTNESTLEITYKPTSSNHEMKVGLSFEEEHNNEYDALIDLPSGNLNEWNDESVDLSEYAGETVHKISLLFESDTGDDVNVNIGKLAVIDQSLLPEEVNELTYDEVMFTDYARAEARIEWRHSKHAELYLVSRVSEGKKEFLGATYNNAFYTDTFERQDGEEDFYFEVRPVSKTGDIGEAANLSFDWLIEEGTAEIEDLEEGENFALNQPAVSNVEVENDGPVSNINDGIIPLSKWATVGGASQSDPHTATIDLGEEKDISRWVVHHANAPGAREDKDMNTIDFELRYAKDDGEAQLEGDTEAAKERVEAMEFEVADSVEDNTLDITDRNLEEPVKARYVQLYVTDSDRSPWKATRIYEFEVYEETHDAKTEAINSEFVKAFNEEGSKDKVVVKNVTEGDTVYLYESLDAKEAIAEQEASEENDVLTFDDLDFGEDAGRIYYSTKNPDMKESVRRSVPYDAEKGDKLEAPTDDQISLLQSLNGNPSTTGESFGILRINDLEDGSRIEIYEKENDTFPILQSAPSKNGKAKQSRIPLNKDGVFYAQIIKEGKNSSERFPVTFDDELLADVYSLQTLYDKYQNLLENNYTIDSWTNFKQVMKQAEDIVSYGQGSVNDIVTVRESLKEAANNLEEREEPVIDTDKLARLIEKASEYNEEDYTSESYQVLMDIMTNAKEVIENPTDQSEIDDILTQLEEAIEQLKEISEDEGNDESNDNENEKDEDESNNEDNNDMDNESEDNENHNENDVNNETNDNDDNNNLEENEDSNDANKNESNDGTTESKDDNNNNEGSTLPKTATNMFNWLLVGVIVLIVGIVSTVVIQRKK